MEYNKELRGEELKASIIEYIEYDDNTFTHDSFNGIKLDKDEVLRIIEESIISFDPTGTFGNKNYFFREYVEIKVPISLKSILEKYKDYLYKICKIYYEPDGDYEFWGVNILPQKKK